jgi:hypothetical protein
VQKVTIEVLLHLQFL